MATISSLGAVLATNATDADFRRWAQFIHDTFNLAWVQTSDTGQINLTTVTTPGAANTAQGYEIWRMADTLQSTFPVYLKIEYGSGGAAASPMIWLTIGKGSDGSGNITTVRFSRFQLGCNTNNAGAHDGYGSADTNRISVATACASGALRGIWFSIERSKDSSGDDTSDGLILCSTITTNPGHVFYVRMNDASQPSFERYNYVRSINAAFDSNVGMGIVIPIAGVAKQPGYNCFVARSGDFSDSGQPTIIVYGNTITLQGLYSGAHPIMDNGSADATGIMFMRFD